MALKNTKEIAKVKLTLTTNCNANCGYCFVKKTKERMPFAIAKGSVDFLLDSPGKDKLLALFGGEPFLEFPLIEKIVLYARKKEAELDKRLTISICSNLLLLDEKKLDFLRQHRIKVTVSLVGNGADHNKFRSALGKTDVHAKVLANLRKLAAAIPYEDIGISFVVIPRLSAKMYDYFFNIIRLGVSNNINFEIIQEFEKWKKTDRERFIEGFHKIVMAVMGNIEKDNFIFINPISWELGKRKLTKSYVENCPFEYNVEIYPSGDMAFSPFLLNEEEIGRFVVGNVRTGLRTTFRSCLFAAKSERCNNCENNYYDGHMRNDDAHFVTEAYLKMSLAAATEIERRAKVKEPFRRYMAYAKKNLCF